MRVPLALLLAFQALLLSAPGAAPLAAQTGVVAGRVSDAESRQPLANVQVQLLGGTTAVASALTNAAGDFRLTVPPGTYALVAQSVGFAEERIDGVSVGADQTRTVDVALRSVALQLNPLLVVGSRREEKALDAPANVTVVGSERIEERAAVSPVEHVRALAGVDVAQTGVTQATVVTRGFNNIFSGALLVLTDNRYAAVPSLRFNAYNMIPLNSLDPERMEVLLGPASALYGPNAANGVLHIITSSPLDQPGTALAVAGGERGLFHGQFRHASALTERVGFKVSGQYFRATDWRSQDPEEIRQQLLDPANPRIGARDFAAERWGGEARVDYRPGEDTEAILAAGLSDLASSIEMTGVGAAQARNWRYSYLQGRLRSGRLFAQTFLNQSDAGDTYLLRTGAPIVDESRTWVGQVQHGATLPRGLDLIYGVDLQRTEPRTGGTLTGRYEDDDLILEAGAYVHGDLPLTSSLRFVGALRADHHSRLDDPVLSPRAALVLQPLPDQSFRLTFNRAFSTPTTNNLFLDLLAGRIGVPPDAPLFGYDVRLTGVPAGGMTFESRCPGGVRDLCMRTPIPGAPTGPMPASAVPFWNLISSSVVLSALPAERRLAVIAALSDPGRPGDPALASMLRRLDFAAVQAGRLADAFPADPGGPAEIERLRPTITNTLEAGYKGILGGRLLLAGDVWASRVQDFVGPLRVETPSVFLDSASVQTFVLHRLGPLLAAGQVTPAQAALIIRGASSVPVGTVVPDHAESPELVVTYRNFGELNLWGADVALQFLATDRFSLRGSASLVSEDCFDTGGDRSCAGPLDVALNAPRLKGSVGARWADAVRGMSLDGMVRMRGGFPMNSGVYGGRVEGYGVVDANASYRLPWVPGAMLTLSVTNLLDHRHRQAVGAPELGRLALLRLLYRIR